MGEWEEGDPSDDDEKVTQESMIDADAEKVTVKKEARNSSNADKNKVDKK